MNDTKKLIDIGIRVPLSRIDRSRLDAVCGPGRKEKRGQWVAEAIRRYLDEVEAREAARRMSE